MASPSPLSKANTSFSLALFRELGDNDRTANLFYSPFSISSALAMVLLGAGGNTATEMSKVGRAISASVWKSSELFHQVVTLGLAGTRLKAEAVLPHLRTPYMCGRGRAGCMLVEVWLPAYLWQHVIWNRKGPAPCTLLEFIQITARGKSRSWPVRIPHLTGFNRGELSMKCSSWSGCVTVAVIVAVRYHKEMRRWINSWTSQFIQLLLTVANLTDFQWPKFVGCLMT